MSKPLDPSEYGQYHQELMKIEDWSTCPPSKALKLLGQLTDLSWDLRNEEGLERAIEVGNSILEILTSDSQLSQCHYFLGNAWGYLGKLRGSDEGWHWDQKEIEKDILHQRSALMWADSATDIPSELKCQMLTNTGNTFIHLGRCSEAIPFWKQAIKLNPRFAMAVGNLGHGLFWYGRVLSDEGYQSLFINQAYRFLSQAMEIDDDPHFHSGAKKGFSHTKQWIEDRANQDVLEETWDLDSFPLGDTSDENKYRKWCLEFCLFLNILNDLGPYPIAARDVLSLPSITVGIDEGPHFLAFFDQLKQEYVSARYLFYEGTELASFDAHYSDKQVRVHNTLDYPAFCIAVEKIKASFRITYSLFDKIAYFMNRYFELEVSERLVDFRTIWYNTPGKNAKPKKELGVRKQFQENENWPLRGLFWLSKDFFYEDESFQNSIEPDAQKLNEIRNHLEHKYFKLHNPEWQGLPPEEDRIGRAITDTLAYHMYRTDFERKTIKLLKLARAALIYLCLSIHSEETRRESQREDKLVMPNYLPEWEDDWKT